MGDALPPPVGDETLPADSREEEFHEASPAVLASSLRTDVQASVARARFLTGDSPSVPPPLSEHFSPFYSMLGVGSGTLWFVN